ncbi:hypothetical protein L228DRAFT_247638 [Xylona heveae TC161]|uniref:Fibronectin type-III domain-containing protein n=1 Tax=Xylona heveae (strain CBS 132557 / TC161) TaxID=1328760 RepID=A0A165GCJ2_XYLHT|nr:hypothetical protein L228DRAFT_247638 [Xylona heveae TC161]KZF22027.1 hypothetical protein L228DRAFT_247638 [Xylona heveae TC161]
MSLVAWLSGQLPDLSPEMFALINLLATVTAVAWLLYRAWLVFQKPLPELIEVLGLDVPAAPDVSLAGIKSDSITLYWKLPENPNTVVKHLIQVNGVVVGESARHETSINVTGLKPDTFYVVRVIATNPSNFQTPSPLIRLKTWRNKEGPDHLLPGALCTGEKSNSTPSAGDESPGVKAHGTTLETATAVPTAPLITRDQSVTSLPSKRLGVSRRQSPANTSLDQSSTAQVGLEPEPESESEHTVQELTEVLEGLRKEQEESDKQAGEEEEEFQKGKSALIQEREQLRQALKEREDASADLRKQVASLERNNRQAQARKVALERTLQQKLDERNKMKEDIRRWRRDIEEMRQSREDIVVERNDYLEASEHKVEDLRKETTENLAAVKMLEEDIREKGIHIKDLEEAKKKQEEKDEEEAREAERIEKEKDRQWEAKLRGLQAQYTSAWNTLQQAQANYQQAQERLSFLNSRLNNDPVPINSISGSELDLAGKKNKPKRIRQRKSRTNTLSSTFNDVPGADNRFSISTPVSIPNISPTFASSSPFFNMSNGMAIPGTSEEPGMTQAERDALTGGAPMSPTADALLPRDLLGDEDMQGSPIKPSSANTNGFSGLGPAGLDPTLRGPTSPVSDGSSPSVFSSPRESLNNLHAFPTGSEGLVDADRRSVHSTGPSFGMGGASDTNLAGSRRLASLFGLNRQRGKTLPNEPPVLGSLKPGQSQSFPRNIDQGNGELDPIGTRRRRGSHSGSSWVSPMMTSLLNRSTAISHDTSGEDATGPVKHTPSRRRHFNMFSSRYDPLEPSKFFPEAPASRRTSSDRPSIETTSFPRPSSDNQPFGWPTTETPIHRSSPLVPDWFASESWSRTPSRRPSIQYGSSSNLPLSMTQLDSDPLQSAISRHTPPPAPIGTRPLSSQRPITPKLNPTAPTFRTFFGLGDPRNVGQEEEASNKQGDESLLDFIGTSPSDSRKSKDARSIKTADSIAESYDSLEQAISEPLTSSLASSKDKESFIQKLTRKGSSGMFNMPWTKDKGGLFKKSGDLGGGPYETDEEAAAGASDKQMDRSTESIPATSGHSPHPSSGGGMSSIFKGSLRRKQKKDEKDRAIVNEMSEKASATGEEADEHGHL